MSIQIKPVTTNVGDNVYISKFALIEGVGIFEATITHCYADDAIYVEHDAEIPAGYDPDYYDVDEYHTTREEAIEIAKEMCVTAIAESEAETNRLRELSFEKIEKRLNS